MKKKRINRSSGIGGQAVLEGVMMKNKEEYAVSVRKPNGEIETDIEVYCGVLHGSPLKRIPFIRGTFNFIDSLVLGLRTVNYSASFYDDGELEETKLDKALNKLSGGRAEKILMGLTTVFSVVLAVAVFILLPYYLSSLLNGYIRNPSLLAILEGLIRIAVFLAYIIGISLMKDIHRLYQYHGAEHKCINCIEKGRALTVKNVMISSRIHKRCGTSFMFFVIFVSVILFFFIRVENPAYRVLLRIALIPVIAGISYEIIRLAGRTDNILINMISAPGMFLQKLTTKEPDESMVEVAIKSVEAVFDWKEYLRETFNYDVDDYAEEESVGQPQTEAAEKIEESETLQAEPDEETEELEALQAESDEEAEELEALQAKLAEEIEEIEVLQTEADEKTEEIEVLQTEADEKTEEIKALQAEDSEEIEAAKEPVKEAAAATEDH